MFDHEDDKSDEEEEIEVVKQESGIKRIYLDKFFSSPFDIRLSLMKQG